LFKGLIRLQLEHWRKVPSKT